MGFDKQIDDDDAVLSYAKWNTKRRRRSPIWMMWIVWNRWLEIFLVNKLIYIHFHKWNDKRVCIVYGLAIEATTSKNPLLNHHSTLFTHSFVLLLSFICIAFALYGSFHLTCAIHWNIQTLSSFDCCLLSDLANFCVCRICMKFESVTNINNTHPTASWASWMEQWLRNKLIERQ